MSSALIGCLFGALSAGKLSDRLGRKPILILAAGLFICTAVSYRGGAFFLLSLMYFVWWGALPLGLLPFVTYVYSRNSSAHLRGRFVSINQLDGSVRYLDFSDC